MDDNVKFVTMVSIMSHTLENQQREITLLKESLSDSISHDKWYDKCEEVYRLENRVSRLQSDNKDLSDRLAFNRPLVRVQEPWAEKAIQDICNKIANEYLATTGPARDNGVFMKIQTIKYVRERVQEVTGFQWGLKDCKDFVEAWQQVNDMNATGT
jgi:hypothetical protein